MLLMCDQSAVMSRDDGGPDGEEPALPSSSAAAEEEERMPPAHQGRLAQTDRLGGGERGALREEVGQEDEEMTNSSQDLSSSANQSPESATGSTSSFTKRYRLRAYDQSLKTVTIKWLKIYICH